MPDKHAVLSASGAHRWLNCPPSALLEAKEKDSSSEAARQGTLAHALAECKLRRFLNQDPGTQPEGVDEEMEACTDDYVDFIATELTDIKKVCADPLCLIEERLDFSHIVPGGFGTGDCVIIAEPVLHVIDFKYGQGVLVEAKGNAQMRLYAIGALEAYRHLYAIERVKMTIFQPRREHVDTEEMSVKDLDLWADEVVRPIADLASRGEGLFAAGSWCQFCKIAPRCRKRAEENLALARYEFAPSATLADSEIEEILSKIPELTTWAGDVQTYALEKALSGKSWSGYKLVEGRSIRKYTDEKAVKEALDQAGVRDYYKHSLLGIGDMERKLGKSRFSEILGSLIYKPQGKPALVPLSDKRPALTNSAKDDFKEM